MAARRLIAAAAALVLLASSSAAADDDAKPPEAGAHAERHVDKPFAATSHRKFDNVEYWTGVFDADDRDDWQMPDRIVAALALQPGNTVADLGAGTGYMLGRLSRAVGETGTVFAVEVEPALVAHLRGRAEKQSLRNVVPVLTSLDRPRLPAGSIDVLFVLDTFHHLDRRDVYLEEAKKLLAPGGRIAVVDWRKKKLPEGPPPPHKIARETVISELESVGMTVTAELDELPYHYVLIFETDER